MPRGSLVAVAAVLSVTLSAGAQVTLSVDRLDGADPGSPAPANLIVVDVFADLASTDAWTASGLRAVAGQGAVLVYGAGNAFINPGLANRFVTCVSKPLARNDDARFNNAAVATAGRHDPAGPTPVTTPTEANFSWFASPPVTSTTPSADGYIARIVLDVNGVAGLNAATVGVTTGLTPPAGTVALLTSGPSSGTGNTGTAAATFDVPAISGRNWVVYGTVNCNPRLYVDASATGANNGTSWANAFTSLQSALNTIGPCVGNSEIWVANGTYRPAPPNGDRTASFSLRTGVAVYGGFAGSPVNETSLNQRNVTANRAVLSGDLNGNDGANFVNNAENSFTVVTAAGVGNTAVLDGFTISGGNNNGAADDGGGIRMIEVASPTIRRCTIVGNTVTGFGGGVYSTDSAPTLDSCVIADNQAVLGAGVYVVACPDLLRLHNSVIVRNTASSQGGGLRANNNALVSAVNCTFAGNSASLGAAIATAISMVNVVNCILHGNTGSVILGDPPVTYSLVQGGYAGTGNLNADPLFVSPALGDYRIQPGSPCIDAANSAAVPAGTLLDIARRPRFFDDPRTLGTGVPLGDVIVDMGAHEHQGCRADFNESGLISVQDIFDFLAAYFTGCP